jgi:hypothetical protein
MNLISSHYQPPLAMIKEIAVKNETDYEFSGHALVEMADDCVDELDVRNVLIRSTKAIEQIYDDGVKYLVQGRDTDGRRIDVVIRVEEAPPAIFVITVWKVKRR